MNTADRNTNVSHWLVTENDNQDEYPGIIESKTQMQLGPHPKGNTGMEWQIQFVNPSPTPASWPAPPAVAIIRLAYVTRSDRGRGTTKETNASYFDQAVETMRRHDSYYVGVGYDGSIPTLIVLELYPASGSPPMRSFELMLVKLAEVSGDVSVKQGGVIHGHEN